MPQVIDNPDGTTTFTIDASELRTLADWLLKDTPDADKLLRLVDTPRVRTTLLQVVKAFAA